MVHAAGAHQQRCTDGGFHFQNLPPASPEFNPVERFFEELRKELADHVFDTLEQVEDHLVTILQKYYQHPQTIIQLTHILISAYRQPVHRILRATQPKMV